MSKSFRQEVLDQLLSMGSDVTQPHGFDFYLYLPTASAAQAAAAKLRESEFAARVRPSTSAGKWLCLATATIVPDTAPLNDIAQFLDQVAAALHGDFDGWESEVIKKGNH